MSAPQEARSLMAKHSGLVERIAQWLVNLGRIPRKLFDEACSFGRVGLAEAAHSYDPSQGVFESWAWIRIYGAICNGMKRERRERTRLFAAALDAAGHYAAGLRAAESPASMAPDDALAQMREAGAGLLAALALGYLGGIWRLDPEAQISAREEHARALAALSEETGKLAEREQRLLRLHYTAGLTWPEVAECLGASKSTVERWHSSALRRLATRLRQRGVDERPRPLDTG